jgi:aspartate kinase
MKVFKFGGASVKNAAGVKNVTKIIRSFEENQLLVVISAMGKTTNALEKVVEIASSGKPFASELSELLEYHTNIIRELFTDPTNPTKSIQAFFDFMK